MHNFPPSSMKDQSSEIGIGQFCCCKRVPSSDMSLKKKSTWVMCTSTHKKVKPSLSANLFLKSSVQHACFSFALSSYQVERVQKSMRVVKLCLEERNSLAPPPPPPLRRINSMLQCTQDFNLQHFYFHQSRRCE